MNEPIYFVSRQPQIWQQWADSESPPLPHEMKPPLPVNLGAVGWTLQTYLHLRRRGANVRLSYNIRPGAINVVYSDDIPWKRLPFRGFIVAIQGDRGRPEIADMRIVQNQLCIRNEISDRYMPFWTQPGLKPRDPMRGNRLERLAYYGLDVYLAPQFRSEQFRNELEKIGISLDIRANPSTWDDYTQTDAVLAIRETTDYVLSIKPPTKLLNAFQAGCIPILGSEPAYRQVAIPDEEYFEASQPEQVIAILKKLKSDPALLEQIQSRGRKQAEEFTDDRLAERWLELLNGPIDEQYRRWKKRGGAFGILLRAAQYPSRLQLHWQEKKLFYKNNPDFRIYQNNSQRSKT